MVDLQMRQDLRSSAELLTVGQVATYLNVHPNTVRRWTQQGVLNAYRIGPRRDRRFYLSDVEGLLQGTFLPGAAELLAATD